MIIKPPCDLDDVLADFQIRCLQLENQADELWREAEQLRNRLSEERFIERKKNSCDCGQDGPVCITAPGCCRHWEQRCRELVAERDEARAILRKREPTREEAEDGETAPGRTHVKAGDWTGRVCFGCAVWVWQGRTMCEACEAKEQQT